MAFPIENLLSPNLTNMLITFVIPFLIIFTVLLFAIKKTKVLGDNPFVYVLVSLGLTVMIYAINPGGIFQFLASYLFQIGVAGTVISLGGITVLFFWALIGKGANIAKSLQGNEQKLKSLTEERAKLLKKYYSGGVFVSTGKKMDLLKQLKQKDDEIKQLEDYLRVKYKR